MSQCKLWKQHCISSYRAATSTKPLGRHSQLLQDYVLDVDYTEMELKAPVRDLEKKAVEAKNDFETFKYARQRSQVSLQ